MAQAEALAATPKQNWVLSPVSDFLFIIAAPLLGLVWAVVSLNTMGEAWALSVFMVFNVAHHFPTWVRIYGDRHLVSRFRWTLLLAILVVCLSFSEQQHKSEAIEVEVGTMSADAAVYNIAQVPEGKTDESSFLLALLRDLSIGAVGVGGVLGAYAWSEASSFAYAWPIGALLGALGTLIASSVLHEWGHYLGAKFTGGHAPRNGLAQVFPMFHFDMDNSSALQAAAVGIGGNVVLVLVLLAGWIVFEDGSAAGAGVRLVSVFFVASNAFFEWPIIFDTLRRGDGAAAWHAYLKVRPFRLRLGTISGIVATVAAAFVGG